MKGEGLGLFKLGKQDFPVKKLVKKLFVQKLDTLSRNSHRKILQNLSLFMLDLGLLPPPLNTYLPILS